MLNNLQNWSGSLKIVQSAFLVTMCLYVFVSGDSGFFSVYYAWLLAISGGILAALTSMFQKNATLLMINMALIVLMFIHFMQLD